MWFEFLFHGIGDQFRFFVYIEWTIVVFVVCGIYEFQSVNVWYCGYGVSLFGWSDTHGYHVVLPQIFTICTTERLLWRLIGPLII